MMTNSDENDDEDNNNNSDATHILNANKLWNVCVSHLMNIYKMHRDGSPGLTRQ